jgi:hypothetical protein
MWGFIILSIVLALGVARIIVGYEAQSVMSQWAKYRCQPSIMAFASLFKPNGEPRSDAQFIIDNFNFCTSEIAKSVLEIALKPIFDVVVKMIESAISSIGYVMNLRTLASNLFHGLERMFDIFGRRFNLTVHEFHKTFIKQISALEKANAIATASLFAGLSTIKAIMNAFELMIIVCIVILVILVVLVIFLFFLLAPTIPLIIIVLAIIGGTAYAGSTGGMGDAFCFHPGTMVALKGGTSKLISEINLNDILADGSTVISTMKFKTAPETELWNIDGVIVSGSHIIYTNGKAKFVRESNLASIYQGDLPTYLYCLNTSSHKIPVLGKTQTYIFADWEELDASEMDDWSEFVHYFLNSNEKRVGQLDVNLLESEGGFAHNQKVIVNNNGIIVSVPMCELRLGDLVLDSGGFTKVIGSVKINSSEIKTFGNLNSVQLSGSTWTLDISDNKWKYAGEIANWLPNHPVSDNVAIFTESGTFKIGETLFRDFSDIGLNNIYSSYNFTLSRLNMLGVDA